MCYFQVGKNFHNKHLLLLQKNYSDIRSRDDGKVKLLLQIHSNILTTHTTLVASAASAAIMAVVATAAATVALANK